jgi:ergothioneine biosynthesis protein EgtB
MSAGSAALHALPEQPVTTDRYAAVRAQTEALCEPLEIEDYVVSSMADVSPTKWHLAHTTWFFETFVLAPFVPLYASPNPGYAFLFNSYYVQAGERHCRAQRGLATRPTVREVFGYRAHVDEALHSLIERIAGDIEHPALPLIELGLQHEQQHQELLITDIKHVFWTNPLRPALGMSWRRSTTTSPLQWQSCPEGIYHIGHRGSGFAFDNELPSHRVFLDGFLMASRLVTKGEYLAFINDRGYASPELWLSSGWAAVQERHWEAPLYWERAQDGWMEFTLGGMQPIASHEAVCHVSYYEADAFARWAGQRLPAEAEWEVAASSALADRRQDGKHETLAQLQGETWQWTRSPYIAYPNFVPATGAIGEYNGKWMADQWVLRGSSFATPPSHARLTYRNFFPADTRWQFAGIRLARSA